MTVEFGKMDFSLDQLTPEDLRAELNFVILGRTSMGSAVILREALKGENAFKVIMFSMSGQNYYIAKWHELTAEKQDQLRHRD